MKNIRKTIRKAAPAVLAGLGAIGVVATAVAAAKAAPKAETLIRADSELNHDGDPEAYTKKEAVISAWKCYIPTVIIGTATITCIISSNLLTRKQQAALTGAYVMASKQLQDYRSKAKELYGEDADKKIMDAIVTEKAKDITLYSPGMMGNPTLDFGDLSDPEKKRTFYDCMSERYFESTISRVLQAEYHLNRNFILGGGVCVNDLYDFLGIDRMEDGGLLGWTGVDGDIYWIDFEHHLVRLDDGMEILYIQPVFSPVENWDEDI